MRKAMAILAAVVFLAAGVEAQINPFGRYSSDRLTEEDKHLAEQASAKIYQAPAPPVGTSEGWNNPGTGNRGTVTLVGFREYQGLPCRTLRYTVEFSGTDRPVELTLDRCRTGDGQWKIL